MKLLQIKIHLNAMCAFSSRIALRPSTVAPKAAYTLWQNQFDLTVNLTVVAYNNILGILRDCKDKL